MIKGTLTALVTPFVGGVIDYDSLDRLIEQQLEAGIEGFVVCGTTAESPTLTETEQLAILEFVCNKVSGKVPVIFGSGSNSTAKTIELSNKASLFPIDALLVVVPYYNKPTQDGLVQHFTAVADNCKKPVLLYNVPGRTITALAPETVVSLSRHPNICGIKEADGDMQRFDSYKNDVAENFVLLSGDDETAVSFCHRGGHGVISVCSHVSPGPMVDWIKRATAQDNDVASEFETQKTWIRSLYLSSNPIPVKKALQLQGTIKSAEMRLPLTTMAQDLSQKMASTLKEYGLLQ